MKGYVMTVFGEEYDLSKCTSDEQAEVAAWYEKNKDETVPEVGDSPSNHVDSEVDSEIDSKPSSDLDIALALESLQGNTTFDPILEGKPKHIELYKLVHPLGGNLSVEDAAKGLGINKVTAYRWLDRIQAQNPDSDLDKWPTRCQLDAYRLIHPDLGGLTRHEAAKALGCTYQHLCNLMCRMRKTHPQAFSFERVPRPEIVRYDPSVHDGEAVEKF